MASDAAAGAWRGVHPLSVFVNFVPRIWALVRTAWPVLLAVLYGGRSQEGLANALILLLVFGLPFASSVVHAMTLRYRVAAGRLEIRSGLFNRQARAISLDRIQNVERVQNVFQRLSGLVEVRIETASGAEVEGLLSAISTGAADELAYELTGSLGGRRSLEAGGEEPEPEVLARCTTVDLVWYGAADLRLGAISMLLAVVFEVQPNFGGALAERASALLGVAVIGAALSGGWLLGIAAAVIRFHGFVLTRIGDVGAGSLVAVHGLLTRRRTELRRGKVQVVTWNQPLLLRAFGLGALAIETAAAREEGSGTERSVAVVPCVEPESVGRLVAEALGTDAVDPATAALLPPHPRAAARAVTAAAIRWTVLASIVGWLLFPLGLAAFLAVPLAVGLARLDVSRQGWLLTDGVVVARRGVLTRRTAIVPRSKVQSVAVDQGPVLRRLGLGVLTVRVAGSRVELPALGWADAVALHETLIAGTRRPGDRPGGNPAPEEALRLPAGTEER
jgi:putative membrane protein